ncbi:MAG: choice-of-anchor V domain-containing protein [Chitinophagales bacterium]
MKRIQVIGIGFSLVCLWVILMSNAAGRASSKNTGNTGGPGETTTCSSCHSGGSFGTVSLTIQLFSAGTTNAVTSYTPGTLYDLRVTINHTSGSPAGYGFQLTGFKQTGNTPLSDTYSNLASNVKKKTLTSGTYSGRTYCEHNGVSSSNIFNMSWTAPAAGTGAVVFYAAGDAVNGNSSDSQDKSGSSSLTVTEAAALTATGTVTNVNCFGGTTGAINLTPAGGASGYSYQWSNSATTQDLSGIAAGTYTVTVTDAASATTTASFTVTQPAAALSLNAAAGTILCNGGTTTVTLTASGGTPSYSYSGTTTNLSAGSYNYTVTDSKGCTANASATITQPTALQVTTNSNLAASCFGGSVNIAVNASGGTPPYSGTGTFSATAGSHTYTVTDANNCSKQLTVTVTQPAQLTASATNDTIPCSGGSATIVVSAAGGTGPYTGTGTFNPSSPGTYTYTVTDANNCSVNANAIVSSTSGLVASLTQQNALCNGGCSGSADITVSGGTAPFVYNWSNGLNTQDAANLCAGTYTQTITDNAGCNFVNNITITEPAVLALQANPSNSVVCYGDSVLVNFTPTGGVAPYVNYSSVWYTAGSFTSMVTDANGCTANTTVTVINAPQLTVSTSVNGSTGSNGTITATPTGGTAPYTYNWSNTDTTQTISNLAPGTYDLTVTDANGCFFTSQGIEVALVNGISENTLTGLSVYPNPAEITLYVSLQNASDATVAIIDFNGREVLNTAVQNQKSFNIDLSSLAEGMYVLRLTNSNSVYSKRFMKN